MTYQRERPAPLEGGNGPTSITARTETRPENSSTANPEPPVFKRLRGDVRLDGTSVHLERDHHSPALCLTRGRPDRNDPTKRWVLDFIFIEPHEILRLARAMHSYARRLERERGGR
jgi:hypothetical protein